MLSSKSTKQIVLLKGMFSGIGSFIIAIVSKEMFPQIIYVVFAMLLGSVSYGLSIFFYVKAQSRLGAAKTSARFCFAPGARLILFNNKPVAFDVYSCYA